MNNNQELKPPKIDEKTLDKAENILQSIPVVNKLEIGNFITFLKLVITQPLVALSIFAVGLATVDYRNTNELTLLLTSLFFLLILVVFGLIKEVLIHRSSDNLDKFHREMEYKEEVRKIIEKTIFHEEAMRTEWFLGWKQMLLVSYDEVHQAFLKVLKSNMNDIDKKEAVTILNQASLQIKEKYQSVFENMDNYYKNFLIGYKSPVPQVLSDNISRRVEALKKVLNQEG